MQAGMASIAFILKGRMILMMQQGERSFAAGRWSVVGGKAEAGETPRTAVLREVEEETGLVLTRVADAGHVFLYQGESVTSLSLFLATEFEGHMRGSDEGEPEWVPLAEVEQLPLVEYLRLLLPLVLEPGAYVAGTIELDDAGILVRWELDQHTRCERRGA